MLDFLSYDTKSSLKSFFWHENTKILPYIFEVIMSVIK